MGETVDEQGPGGVQGRGRGRVGQSQFGRDRRSGGHHRLVFHAFPKIDEYVAQHRRETQDDFFRRAGQLRGKPRIEHHRVTIGRALARRGRRDLRRFGKGFEPQGDGASVDFEPRVAEQGGPALRNRRCQAPRRRHQFVQSTYGGVLGCLSDQIGRDVELQGELQPALRVDDPEAAGLFPLGVGGEQRRPEREQQQRGLAHRLRDEPEEGGGSRGHHSACVASSRDRRARGRRKASGSNDTFSMKSPRAGAVGTSEVMTRSLR